MVTLQIRSRELGYRYLVRDIDWCEVWTPDHRLLAEFPAHLVLAMLLQYLAHADTTTRLREALAAGEVSRLPLFPVLRPAPTPDLREPVQRHPVSEARPVSQREKATLRLARRARARRTSA